MIKEAIIALFIIGILSCSNALSDQLKPWYEASVTDLSSQIEHLSQTLKVEHSENERVSKRLEFDSPITVNKQNSARCLEREKTIREKFNAKQEALVHTKARLNETLQKTTEKDRLKLYKRIRQLESELVSARGRRIALLQRRPSSSNKTCEQRTQELLDKAYYQERSIDKETIKLKQDYRAEFTLLAKKIVTLGSIYGKKEEGMIAKLVPKIRSNKKSTERKALDFSGLPKKTLHQLALSNPQYVPIHLCEGDFNDRINLLWPIIEKEAKIFQEYFHGNIDVRKLIIAIIERESYACTVESWANARGVMQLIPGTARDMGVVDRYNPSENIHGGTKYLAFLCSISDCSIESIAKSYVAGPNRTSDTLNTVKYAKNVSASYSQAEAHIPKYEKVYQVHR